MEVLLPELNATLSNVGSAGDSTGIAHVLLSSLLDVIGSTGASDGLIRTSTVEISLDATGISGVADASATMLLLTNLSSQGVVGSMSALCDLNVLASLGVLGIAGVCDSSTLMQTIADLSLVGVPGTSSAEIQEIVSASSLLLGDVGSVSTTVSMLLRASQATSGVDGNCDTMIQMLENASLASLGSDGYCDGIVRIDTNQATLDCTGVTGTLTCFANLLLSCESNQLGVTGDCDCSCALTLTTNAITLGASGDCDCSAQMIATSSLLNEGSVGSCEGNVCLINKATLNVTSDVGTCACSVNALLNASDACVGDVGLCDATLQTSVDVTFECLGVSGYCTGDSRVFDVANLDIQGSFGTMSGVGCLLLTCVNDVVGNSGVTSCNVATLSSSTLSAVGSIGTCGGDVELSVTGNLLNQGSVGISEGSVTLVSVEVEFNASLDVTGMSGVCAGDINALLSAEFISSGLAGTSESTGLLNLNTSCDIAGAAGDCTADITLASTSSVEITVTAPSPPVALYSGVTQTIAGTYVGVPTEIILCWDAEYTEVAAEAAFGGGAWSADVGPVYAQVGLTTLYARLYDGSEYAYDACAITVTQRTPADIVPSAYRYWPSESAVVTSGRVTSMTDTIDGEVATPPDVANRPYIVEEVVSYGSRPYVNVDDDTGHAYELLGEDVIPSGALTFVVIGEWDGGGTGYPVLASSTADECTLYMSGYSGLLGMWAGNTGGDTAVTLTADSPYMLVYVFDGDNSSIRVIYADGTTDEDLSISCGEPTRTGVPTLLNYGLSAGWNGGFADVLIAQGDQSGEATLNALKNQWLKGRMGWGSIASYTMQAIHFPGNGETTDDVRFVFSSPLGSYPATYIHRVYYHQAANVYHTTFFWGNATTFEGTLQYYGCHPYPDWAGSVPMFEVSANGGDTTTDDNANDTHVETGRWYTQAVRVYVDGSDIKLAFYWDLPDTSRVITVTLEHPDDDPTAPALFYGDAPWNQGNERLDGYLRGIQVYEAALSVADILAEIAEPLSTAAGAANIWYMKINPTPTDVADESGNGHTPAWASSNHGELWQG